MTLILTEEQQLAYAMGVLAHSNRKSFDGCPFKKDSTDAAAWSCGWWGEETERKSGGNRAESRGSER